MKSDRVVVRQLGTTLLLLRHERRLRQYMLADLAGISKAMLSSYETGQRCPSVTTLVKILAALGISWQDFGRILAQTGEVLQ